MDRQGVDAGRYRVVPRTLVFVRRGERVLLLRRADDRRVLPGMWNGVGGHVEAGECIADSALREVREETGVAVGALRLAGLLHVTDPAPPLADGVLVAVFTAEGEGDLLAPSAEGVAGWVSLDEAKELDLVPDLRAILPRLWKEPAEPFLAVQVPGRDGGAELRFASPG